MDDDSGPTRHRPGARGRRRPLRAFLATAFLVALALLVVNGGALRSAAPGEAAQHAESAPDPAQPPVFTLPVIFASVLLMVCSAFFSASEVAYFSLHKVRVRAMRESSNLLSRLTANLLEHPGSLLTTILMGNSIVNVLLSVVLGSRLERFFARADVLPVGGSYVVAILLSTCLLVFFGEIIPKVLVMWHNEAYARTVAAPLFLVSQVLAPLRNGMLLVTAFLFRVTRFSDLVPAPFMTDDELKSVLSESEASGVIETDELRMIEGILEFTDMTVREILIPRPDVVALHEDASIREALGLLREHEFARIPVHRENLDQITGVLYTKDLLPAFREGDFEKPVKPLLRKPLFVPETMTVAEFIKTSQRVHMHLAIVVDEYGGTEGVVTLQDALRELVGEFGDEVLVREPLYEPLDDGVYRAEGNLPLDDLEELVGSTVEDEEHTTVGGFLMGRSEKILEVGDEIEYEGVRFVVEEMDRHRVARVRIEVPRPGASEDGEGTD